MIIRYWFFFSILCPFDLAFCQENNPKLLFNKNGNQFFVQFPASINEQEVTSFINKSLAYYKLPNNNIPFFLFHSGANSGSSLPLAVQNKGFKMNLIRLSRYLFEENKALTQAVLGHEIGHIIYNHTEREAVVRGCTLGVASATCCYHLQNIDTKNPFSFNNGIIALKCFGILCAGKSILSWYSRKCEREADEYIILHTKNPAVLYAASNSFKNMPLSTFQRLRIFNSHPLPYERAVYFEKAAHELEKKQGCSNSSDTK